MNKFITSIIAEEEGRIGDKNFLYNSVMNTRFKLKNNIL